MVEYLDTYGEILKPYIGDTSAYLRKAAHEGKKILYEAQLGVLRDIDFGIYPYTSSSSPLAAYAPIGSGAPDIPVNRVIGVVKAYSTCVGEGPFTAEWFGEEAERLRKEGGEYGAATGRPPQSRPHRPCCNAVRRSDAGCNGSRAHKARHPFLHGFHPRLRRIRMRR